MLSTSPGSTVDVSGNLLGDTQNSDAFAPQGNVIFDGAGGTSNPPQLLEAMSSDLGAIPAGFVDNFAYSTISLTANSYVQLVDQAHNSGGTGPEAVYAEGLILAAGATLDLNGLHLYVRGSQVASTARRIPEWDDHPRANEWRPDHGPTELQPTPAGGTRCRGPNR